jgi:signal transduction histidine kinase/PAS domain-containing protein
MATVVPGPSGLAGVHDYSATFLESVLDAMLEMATASVGWVAVMDATRGLVFPSRRGVFSQTWLTLQQGQAAIWGFEVKEGVTLINDLPPLPALGDPCLRNLLSCSLMSAGQSVGHIALANKSTGFTSQDALTLQTGAQLLVKHLQQQKGRTESLPSASLLRQALDLSSEGVLVVDQDGRLVFSNATWSQWSGYNNAELWGRMSPFPFWVSHLDLASLRGPPPRLPQRAPRGAAPALASLGDRSGRIGCLPFRHRNHSLFWCQVETVEQERDGQHLTFALLRRLPASGSVSSNTASDIFSFQTIAENLPFGLILTDSKGQILWANARFSQGFGSTVGLPGHRLQSVLDSTSAVLLDRLFRDPDVFAPEGHGLLVLQPAGNSGTGQEIHAYWQKCPLSQGAAFMFAIAEDWAALWLPKCLIHPSRSEPRSPEPDCLPLLWRPDAPAALWDDHWEQLTGITRKDAADVPGDVLLDWLFPRQGDREFIADVLHSPAQRGTQAVLEVAIRTGNRGSLCTFLPIQAGQELQAKSSQSVPSSSVLDLAARNAWLLLVSPSQPCASREKSVQGFLRQITRGLSRLLNHHLSIPITVAESALDRGDLPVELGAAFVQILEHCMRAGQLIGPLQDLATATLGEAQRVSLAEFVRSYVRDFETTRTQAATEITLDLENVEALVDINLRMIGVVLGHLLTNAAQALMNQEFRRIDVRVTASLTEVRCEVHDSGEGLALNDWSAALAPFYSTKGAFAHDAGHASIEAFGLGLTVSQHLLSLHNGRLELRSMLGEGTTAAFVLPRVREELSSSEVPSAAHEGQGLHPAAGLTGPKAESHADSDVQRAGS